ncbi:MAG: magnesium transporter [Fidelibacterota bacterium]
MMAARYAQRSPMLDTEVAVLVDTFRRLMRRRARTNLMKALNKTHPADLALLFRSFTESERTFLFDLIKETPHVGEFLTELDSSITRELLQTLEPAEVATLLSEVSSDDMADILHLLPDDMASAVLESLKKEESEELEELMAYPPDTAGGKMAVNVFSLPETTTVGDAIKSIRTAQEAEMVFYLYVTDELKRLTGVVSLRDLVTAQPDAQLKTIMTRDVVSVTPETDQEEVARQVSRYNLLAIPVVGSDGTLLGIVTVDDVVDVIREEATEDFLQMAGIGRDRELLWKPTLENVRLRLPWLFATWVGGVVVAWISGYFESVLSFIAIPAFIPVILGMGGNVGTQSSTIIVRGFATGRIHLSQAGKVIWKQLRIGLVLGLFYGLLLGLVASWRFVDAPPRLGMVVGLAIAISMLVASLIGTLIPILLRRLNVDPAVASGPFVTTSTDLMGIVLYFLIAASLLSAT